MIRHPRLILTVTLGTALAGCSPDEQNGEPPRSGDSSPGDNRSGDSPVGDPTAGDDANPGDPTAPQSAWFTLLDDVDAAASANRQGLVDAWLLSNGPDYPYVEGDLATFLYRGSASDSVFLAGDLNGWDGAVDSMFRVPDTNIFHLTYRMPLDARIDYKYVVNTNWILDPLNPHQAPGGLGYNSEVRMPNWVYPAEIDYYPGVPHGTVNGVTVAFGAYYPPTTFHSTVLNNDRNVWVYLPPGYDAGGSYPTFYVNDGGEYLGFANMANVLDNVLAEGAMEPLIVVFVDPVNRGDEYVGAQIPQYVQLVADELVPWVDGQYATDTSSPLRRGIMGTSNGGYISMRIARDRSELFRVVGSQSGALRADGGSLIGSYQAGTIPLDTLIYMDCGLIYDFVTANRDMRDALTAAGYSRSYAEYNEGHSWGNWRARVDELLRYLW